MNYYQKYLKYKNKYLDLKNDSSMNGGGVNLSLKIVNLATCSLAQYALDFRNNLDRIKKSIEIAKSRGCKYRIGPELEICGYDCGDHFFEMDTITSSWNSILELLKTDLTNDILVDTSLPVLYNGNRYNCRIFLLNKKIILIRPKMNLADRGNYRESRWFKAWSYSNKLEDFTLPKDIQEYTKQVIVPMGFAIIQSNDLSLASEICIEVSVINPPNISLSLEGVDIISNGSGANFQAEDSDRIPNLLSMTTRRIGGVYLYSNHIGYNGSRLLFNGYSMIYVNGKLMNIGEFLTYKEVEVISSKILVDTIKNYKVSNITNNRNNTDSIKRIHIDYNLISESNDIDNEITFKSVDLNYELISATARYLWDYLILNNYSGFGLNYFGDVNTIYITLVIFHMCEQIIKILKSDDKEFKDVIIKKLIKNKIIDSFQNDLTVKKLINKMLFVYIKTTNEIDLKFINEIGAKSMIEGDTISLNNILFLGSIDSDDILFGLINNINKDDFNPIASISKIDLFNGIKYYSSNKELYNIINELLENDKQNRLNKELSFGLTFQNIKEIQKIRITQKLSPLSIFIRLSNDYKNKEIEYINNITKTKEKIIATPVIIATIILTFFEKYILNYKNKNLLSSIHLTFYDSNDISQIRPNIYPNIDNELNKLKEIIKNT